MQTLTIRDSVELAFDAFGQEQDSLMLLISGAGAPAAFWPEAFCRDLAETGRFVVRYCHRDTGFSTHFPEPYSIEELFLDMMDLLASLGNSPVHLVGHSMGGYLAQMAVNHIHAMSTVPASLARDIGEANCPLLAIHGTEDPLVPPDHGQATSRLARHSKLVHLQGAGHMFFNELAWQEIKQAVIAHAKGHAFRIA